MPPVDSGLSLSKDEIQVLDRWIAAGAEYAGHWSFAPITGPVVPLIQDHGAAPSRNPIDDFVRRRLQAIGRQSAVRADRGTLIRRVTLDLTGLPPTPDEVDDFLGDDRPDAYHRLLDRLLASPRFGEHQAVAWLQAARYADTNGYQHDFYRTVYPWRTWVIRALNANQAFDQFVTEQLAGDLLPDATPEQILATCFLRLHRLNSEGGTIDEEFYVENVVDRIETVSTAMMGITIGCARCHDHKFDPFSMRDFYSLFAYFNNGQDKGVDPGGLHARPWSEPVLRYPDVRQQPRLDGLNRQLLLSLMADPPDTERAEMLRRQIQQLRASAPAVMVMRERDQRRAAFVLKRGSYDQRGEQVVPQTPAALPRTVKGKVQNRLDFARWLTSREHPLLARVIVNQYWQSHFGAGLVRTPENFGAQGEPPTHPLLLDWLASEFIRLEWDVKALHRRIVSSATYQQSSLSTAELQQRDPQNRLLARGPRFRLSGFAIRDQALAASGLLVERIGGPSVRPYQPEGMWAEISGDQKLSPKVQTTFYKQDHGSSLYRRSVYTFWKRSVPPPSLSTFDAPNREACAVRRSTTNTPLQALALMNDTTYLEAARHLARQMWTAGQTVDQRINAGVRRVLARTPSPAELVVLRTALTYHKNLYATHRQSAVEFLSHGESPRFAEIDPIEHAAWSQIALMILNLDETITQQ